MIKNYFKITFRLLLKNKKLSAINIFGLAMGMAASALIVLYVIAELSYDKFHSNLDRIYRVESDFYEGDVLTDEWASSAYGYGQAMKDHISGIKDFGRLSIHQTEQIVGYNNQYIRESGVTYADSSFFNIFDFKVLEGDKSSMLNNANSVVITERAAQKIFKNEDAIGKILSFGSKSEVKKYEVTAVIANLPKNSHIEFDYFISYEALPNWRKNYWYMHTAYTYVLLNSGVDPSDVEKAFPELAENYKTEESLKSKIWGVSLIPLKDIHLNKWKQAEIGNKGNRVSLYALLFIASVLLIIAWSNYINISIAQSYKRTLEIAIKKVYGVEKRILLGQFLFESLLVSTVALLIAIVLIITAIPSLNNLVDSKLLFLPLSHSSFWIGALIIFLMGVILSGFYPAFILSSFKTINMLQGKLKVNHKVSPLSFLVVVQLMISLFLMIGTITVYKQIKFMQDQSLGVNITNKIVVKFPAKTENMEYKLKSFSEALKNVSNIKNVTLSGSVPGMEVPMAISNKLKSATADKNRLYQMITVDYDYIDTYDIKLIAGRSYNKSFGDEKQKILINETSLKLLEIQDAKDAIGKEVLLETRSEPFEIIGVTEDWHQMSLNNDYTPIMFLLNGTIEWIPPSYITISANNDKVGDVLPTMKKTWSTYFPNSSLDYFFVDDFYNSQYARDKNDYTIFTIFTILALIITCLGLYALTFLTANKRIKEIGVRKVLGANAMSIVIMLSKHFIYLILIAVLIITPIAWYFMNQWLQGFAFHINVQWYVFIFSSIAVTIITIVTVSSQAIKAAMSNPIKSLRTE